MATKKQLKEQERQEAAARLIELGIKPGVVVKTILRHVSRSGMSRDISLIFGDHNITYLAAEVLEVPLKERHGHNVIRVGGCGMDMGFSLVYRLSSRLFPNGFIPAEAGMYGRNGTPATELDTNGGYALRQEWL